jgi:glycosyltransferase involved in cell wall biosynthesis
MEARLMEARATPLVSVVLPTYNRRTALLEAIASVRAQSFADLEILVCDDGSTDGSREAVQALASADARIRWIQGEHSGLPGSNRNRGIRAARGEWIAFQDSDDLWLPEKLAKQLRVLRAAPQAAFIYCYAAELRADGARRRMTPFRVQREGRMFETLLFYSLVQTPTVLVRRDLLARAGAFDEGMRLTIGEDYELYLRLAAQTEFHFVAEELVLCRASPDSISADLLNGIEQVERVLKSALERERVRADLAARVLARLELRRYKQHLLRNAPKNLRLPHLHAALAKEPGNARARALLLAEKLGAAALVRVLARD